MDLTIRNGMIGSAAGVYQADIGIENGKICVISEALEPAVSDIDARDKIVVPAGVEIHTHIDSMLHGMRTVDDWFDASLGAANGGTATVVDFPLQGPDQTLHETIDAYAARAEGKSIVDYAFTPIITQFNETTYQEIPELISKGITTFKVFMYYDWKIDDMNLARVLDVVGNAGGLLSIHCENAGTINYLIKKCLTEAKTGIEWHAPTRPISTEVEAVNRVISVSEELGVPVLIVHLSSGAAVQRIAEARSRGVQVIGETMPHFLLLDDSYYQDPSRAWQVVMTPPLRSAENQQILWAGLNNGILHTVGSDHCAFPLMDKKRLYETRGSKFTMIPHGVPGIETRLPLMFSEGVSKKKISLEKFVELTSTNPAKLSGLYPTKGTIAVGSDADITIIDPDKEVTLKNIDLHGNTDYTPFEGINLKGYPLTTISRGNILVHDGILKTEKGVGNMIWNRQKINIKLI